MIMFRIISPLRSRSALFLLIAILILCLLIRRRAPDKARLNLLNPSSTRNSQLDWGIATGIFVISLPNRGDRRTTLGPLWKAHRLQHVEYIDATSAVSVEIDRVLAHVRLQRRKERASVAPGLRTGRRPSFKDGMGRYPKDPWGSDLWTSELSLPIDHLLGPDAAYPIPCERGNPFNPHKLPLETQYGATISGPALRKANLLSRGMVACWHSHLRAIRQIAILGSKVAETTPSSHPNATTYIILEDDVDFEWGIQNYLVPVWNALPSDWEVVMLGHCWSDEARHPPLFTFVPEAPPGSPIPSMNVTLHPSSSPLCTHAYALSPRGATRLYNHLRHPAFAYSRALDQAIAWLIRSGNIKGAYSIVPSLVIQTKDSQSDISERKGGSRWRDTLMESTRQRLQTSYKSSWWHRIVQ